MELFFKRMYYAKGNGGDFSSKEECNSDCNKVYDCIDKQFSLLSQNQSDNNLQII